VREENGFRNAEGDSVFIREIKGMYRVIGGSSILKIYSFIDSKKISQNET